MSLETGNWLKDLVESNPLGTDPKSQGDDHLRLLKHVLKQQFAGLSQGKAVTVTEDDLNTIPKRLLWDISIADANLATTPGIYRGVSPFTNFPTGNNYMIWVSATPTLIQQLAIRMGGAVSVWARVNYSGTFDPWMRIDPGIRTVQDVTGSRALSTNYTNSTSCDIDVYVILAGASGANYTALIDGTGVLSPTNAGINLAHSFHFRVPPGSTYRINSNTSIAKWTEVRL